MKTVSAKVYVTDVLSGKIYESDNPIALFEAKIPEKVLTEARTIRERYNLKSGNCKVSYEAFEVG